MPIKGDLDRVDLANIFQMLTLNQNEGTLHVYYGGVHKLIYFTGSGIILPFDQDTMDDRVLSLLLRQGKLTEDQVERARYNTNTLNTGLLGAILQMNYASDQDVNRAIVSQMEEDIYDLFLVNEASFEFIEDEKPTGPQTMDERFLLAPNNLLMEAVRRGDEWAHIRELVPSEVEVFEAVDNTLPEGVDDGDGEYPLIMEAIDGIRSIKSIIEVTRLHRFTVFKKCSVLVESGKITPVDIHQLVRRADDCIRTSRTQDAIDLYERAIAAGIEEADVFEKVGNAYISISEHKKAIQHFYRLSELLEGRGALKQAIKIYLLIREIMPTEIVARERIFQLYLYNRELFEDTKYDAMEEGRKLALVFKNIGRRESGIEVVQLLTEAFRQESANLEELAKMALDIHSPAMALRILEQLGERLLQEGNNTDALRIYRRIKCIDPEHRGIDDRLDRLIEDDLSDRKRHSRVLKTTLLIMALLGLVGVYFVFNSFAFDAFTVIHYDDLMANKEYDEARDQYENFCARFPLSIYWFLARERLGSINTADDRYRFEMDLRHQFNEEENIVSQENAENLFVDAEVRLQLSDLETALRLLKKSRAAAIDPAWIKENELDEKIESLETFFEEASNLKENASKLREAGKFAEAHALLARLVLEYGEAPSVRGVTMPLLVKSNPSGARILIGGEEAEARGGRRAVTPTVLDVTPGRAVEISVVKEGFMIERLPVDVLDNHEVSFELRFRSEKQIQAGKNLAYPPVLAGKNFVLGYRNGRVRLLKTEAEGEGWDYTIKNLQSLESPLGVTESRVYFCWGKNRITALGTADGLPIWEKRLPGRSSLAPLEVQGSVFVALEVGRLVALDARNGQMVLETDLGKRPVLNPIRWDQGLLVVLEDGRILWLDADSGKVVHQRRISATPTAWYRDGKHLLIGNEEGGIDCFDFRTSEVIYSYDSDSKCPVVQLIANGSRVHAVLGGDRMVSLDSTRLQVVSEFRDDGARLFMSPSGSASSVAVGTSHASMYLLRSPDLSKIRKYRGDGEVLFPGVELNGYIYFYTKDGALYGLRY